MAAASASRALFCYWGWEAVGQEASTRSRRRARATCSRDLGRGRARGLPRGRPRARRHHRQLRHPPGRSGPSRARGAHRESGWAGERVAFGRASAILLGDLLVGWSDDLLDEGLAARPRRRRRARAEFAGCAREVTDRPVPRHPRGVRVAPRARRDSGTRAERVDRAQVRRSTSMEQPLTIGGAIAGADAAQSTALPPSASRSAWPSSCATTCSASSATPEYRQAVGRRPPRGQAHGAHRVSRASGSPAAAPARRAARRSRARRRADRDSCSARSSTPAPSTGSSAHRRLCPRRRPLSVLAWQRQSVSCATRGPRASARSRRRSPAARAEAALRRGSGRPGAPRPCVRRAGPRSGGAEESSSPSSQSIASASLKPASRGRSPCRGARARVRHRRGTARHLQHAVDARREQMAVVDELADAARGLVRAARRGRERSAIRSGRRRSRHQPSRPGGRASEAARGERIAAASRTECGDSRRGR